MDAISPQDRDGDLAHCSRSVLSDKIRYKGEEIPRAGEQTVSGAYESPDCF